MATHPGGLRELSLFSGAGGGLLATQHLLGWRAVCYVERDPYCQRVLKQRMADGLLHDAPIWDDCRTFDGKPWRGLVDVISAGFPCQPFSVAGARKAGADERNGWPWVARLVREVGPRYVFLENVCGLLASSHGYFGTVLGDLAESGYDVRWTCLSAAQCGAPHLRNRLWIVATLADAETLADPSLRRCGEQEEGQNQLQGRAKTERPGAALADADGNREKRNQSQNRQGSGSKQSGWWRFEPDVGRVAHGVAARMDRLKALGNGQVPQVVKTAWELLK